MKIKKQKGFSLAEILITLTVVSIMLAVAAPVVTKRSATGDNTWQRTTSKTRNGAAFNGNSVILGETNIPQRSQINDYFEAINEKYFNTENYNSDFINYKTTAFNNLLFNEEERLVSKLSIVKPIQMYQNLPPAKTAFADSHIAFYNLGANNTLSEYAGRIASDQFNLAFGIATLQSLKPFYYDAFNTGLYNTNISVTADSIFNTAIGHYALAHNTTAKDNVGFGYGALFENDRNEIMATTDIDGNSIEIETGSKNTAIGYKAMAETRRSGIHNDLRPYRNTVIGNHMSVLNDEGQFDFENEYVDRVSGRDNIIIGNYDSFLNKGNILPKNSRVSDKMYPKLADWREDEGNQKANEEVKAYTQHIWGNNNILIGNNAGRGLPIYREGSSWDIERKITNHPINTPGSTNGFYSVINEDGETKPSFDNVLAIGNVKMFTPNEYANLSDSDRVDFADQRVELLQATLNPAHRKTVINGDLTIRSADGRRTIFKVDASTIPILIGSSNNLHIDASQGPDRCEGAEVCIGRFATPVLVGNFSTLSEAYRIPKYDIYIRGMSTNRDSGGLITFGTNNIPFLGLSLWYLDRYKDSQGILYSLTESITNSNLFKGLDEIGGNTLSKLFNFLGLSDERLKNIYSDSTAGLKEINALRVKNYTYKTDKNNTPHVGVIAQELQEIFPNSVNQNSNGYLSIKQEEMFYGLIKSIQELSQKSDEFSEKITLSEQLLEDTNQQNKLIEEENKLLEKQNKELAKHINKLQKRNK